MDYERRVSILGGWAAFVAIELVGILIAGASYVQSEAHSDVTRTILAILGVMYTGAAGAAGVAVFQRLKESEAVRLENRLRRAS